MQWAEQLKEEYGKIAKENIAANLPNAKHLALGETGRVNDKIAKDLEIGWGEQYRKAEYINKNAHEEMIKQLDEGQLSINKAYQQLKLEIC